MLNTFVEDGNVELTDYGCVRLVEVVRSSESDMRTNLSAGVTSIAQLMDTVIANLKLAERGVPTELRNLEARRFSRYVMADKAALVEARMRKISRAYLDDITRVLAEHEVSADDIDVVLLGAGIFHFGAINP